MYTVIQRRTVFLTRSDLACVMPFIYFKQLLVLNKQVYFLSWLIISFYLIIFFHFRHDATQQAICVRNTCINLKRTGESNSGGLLIMCQLSQRASFCI